MRARDHVQLAAALAQNELDVAERLEARAKARARLAGALGDRPDAPAAEREEMEDPVCLAVADRAQHDRLGLPCGGGHGSSVETRPVAPRWKLRTAGVRSG